MTVRWKLNISVLAMIAVFLTAMLFVMHTVRRSAAAAQRYSGHRVKSRLVADLLAGMQRYAPRFEAGAPPAEGLEPGSWADSALGEIQTQIEIADGEAERRLWMDVWSGLSALRRPADRGGGQPGRETVERDLHTLQLLYDLQEQQAVTATARYHFRAEVTIISACAVAVLLFLVYLSLVRDWLLEPIRTLEASTRAIGTGDLQHRVPLDGNDELAQLARQIDAMAENLARHQAEMIEARELSALGELCTKVAHGLRNPLAGIRATAQLAEHRADDSATVQALVRELIEEADRMDRRIVKLFDLARPLELRRECLTFAELAQAVRADTEPLRRIRDVTLTADDRTGANCWCVDREQIANAVSELATNAIHHSAGGDDVVLRGEVTPGAGGDGPWLKVQVIDRGVGMSPAAANQAFDLFFTSRPHGTGMGLAIVRRIIEQHGGDVRLESEPGEGTTVTVTLPTPCPCAGDPSVPCPARCSCAPSES